MLNRFAISIGLLAALAMPQAQAQAYEPHMGEIFCAAFNFTPYGFVALNGQLLSINQYSALYALLGTTYGGDGSSTFAVPDLRGRIMVGADAVNYALGRASGGSTTTVGTTTYSLDPVAGQTADATLTNTVASTTTATTTPGLGINCFMAVDGIFPSRE